MRQVLKLRKRRTGQWALLVGASLLLSTQVQEVSAAGHLPTWKARTVEEIKKDFDSSEDCYRYVIKWGDTLSAIAQALEIDISILIQVNDIANADLIYTGNTLYLSQDGKRLVVADGQVAQTYVIQEVIATPWNESEYIVHHVEDIVLTDTEKIEEFLGEDSSLHVDEETSVLSEIPQTPIQLLNPLTGESGETGLSPQFDGDSEEVYQPPITSDRPDLDNPLDTLPPQSSEQSQPNTNPDAHSPQSEAGIETEIFSVQVVKKEEEQYIEEATDLPEVTSKLLDTLQEGDKNIQTIESVEVRQPDVVYIKDYLLAQGTVIVEAEGERQQTTRLEKFVYDQNQQLVSREQVSEHIEQGKPKVIRLGQGVTTVETVRETQKLYNKVREVLDSTLPKGERVLETAGQHGLLTILKRRTSLDGEPQTSEEISRETVPAVDEVWRVGTKPLAEEEDFTPIIDQAEASLYTLYDIDGDGQKELILAEPTTHLERITAVYTLKGGQPTKVIDGSGQTIVNIFDNGLIKRWHIHSNLDLARDIRVDWSRLEQNENKVLHHFIPKYEYGQQTELLPGEGDGQRISRQDYQKFEDNIRNQTAEKLNFTWYDSKTKGEVAQELSAFLTPKQAYLLYEKLHSDYLYPHRLLTQERTNWFYQNFGIDRSKQLIFSYANAGGAGGGTVRFVKRDDGNIDVVSYDGNISFSLRDADSQTIINRDGEVLNKLTFYDGSDKWQASQEDHQRAKEKIDFLLRQEDSQLPEHYNYQHLEEQADYQFLIYKSPLSEVTFGVDLVDDKVYYLKDFQKQEFGRGYRFTLGHSEQVFRDLKESYEGYLYYQDYLNRDSDGDGLLNKDDPNRETWDVSDRDLAIFAALAYESPENLFPVFAKTYDEDGNDITILTNQLKEKINTFGQLSGLDIGNSDEKLFTNWRISDYHGQHVDSFISWYDKLFTLGKSDGLWSNHVVFVDNSNKNVVIAYRGTDEDSHMEEFFDDLSILLGQNKHKDKVREQIPIILSMLDSRGIHYENLYITGHSLGGYLAYHAADKLSDFKAVSKLRKVTNFNGPGLGVELNIGELSVLQDLQRLSKKIPIIHHKIKGSIVNDTITGFGTTHPGEKLEYDYKIIGEHIPHNMPPFLYHLTAGTNGIRNSKDKFKP